MRNWFITGISRGLGLALAQEALRRGDRVVGTVRSGNGPDIGTFETLKVLRLDLAENDSVERAVTEAFAAFGSLDVIVNNAGSGLFGAVEDTTDDEIRRLFEIDVFGPISLIRTALPYLRAQKAGHIINITSIAGRAPGTGTAIYASAKAALEGFSAALANEVASFGVKVTAIAPGQFRTDFMSDTSIHKATAVDSPYAGTVGANLAGLAETYQRQLGDPEQAARVICSVVASENPPLHLLLGSDALSRAELKLSEMRAEMRMWESETKSTDFT